MVYIAIVSTLATVILAITLVILVGLYSLVNDLRALIQTQPIDLQEQLEREFEARGVPARNKPPKSGGKHLTGFGSKD